MIGLDPLPRTAGALGSGITPKRFADDGWTAVANRQAKERLG